MTDERCIHELDVGTCSICKTGRIPKASQFDLNTASIKRAVEDLSANGDFRTKDVAEHAAVQSAHGNFTKDPRFAQHIGTYLTESTGHLGIEQVSAKNQSNARWRRLVS